jgi:HEAT repeat protein
MFKYVTILIAMLGTVSLAQDPVSILITQLQSSDPNVRMSAFYGLQTYGYASSDRVKVAIIDTLPTETAFVKMQSSLSDAYSTYYGDLVAAVASLDDTRSITALLGVVNTGSIATSALAGFGKSALDPLLAMLDSEDPTIRAGIVMTLTQMLSPVNLANVNDSDTMARLAGAFDVASVDVNQYIRNAAVAGNSRLKQVHGDLNEDGRTDCLDIAVVKASFGKKAGQAGFDARADVNLAGC